MTQPVNYSGYYDTSYLAYANYLELAQFPSEHGANTKKDLAYLGGRNVLNIAVSNTDNPLKNLGFIYSNDGRMLSP